MLAAALDTQHTDKGTISIHDQNSTSLSTTNSITLCSLGTLRVYPGERPLSLQTNMQTHHHNATERVSPLPRISCIQRPI